MWLLSYWVFPAVSALMWLGMLLGMLITWATDYNNTKYPSMEAGQRIAYISDVGAFQLKPLFQAGSVITVVLLDIGIIAERWLRHTGRLARNTSITQKVLSCFAILFAIAGAAGLILLSTFDTYNYPRLHDYFLLLFIGGYIISAIFMCVEYQRLGIHYRNHRILATSFWIKLAFIIVEIVLAIVFAACSYTSKSNIAGVFEWIVAFIYTFWVLSFLLDLLPSVRTKKHIPQGLRDAAMEEQGQDGVNLSVAAQHNGRFSEQSTRVGSYEPNGSANKHVADGQSQPRKGRLSKLFSNLY